MVGEYPFAGKVENVPSTPFERFQTTETEKLDWFTEVVEFARTTSGSVSPSRSAMSSSVGPPPAYQPDVAAKPLAPWFSRTETVNEVELPPLTTRSKSPSPSMSAAPTRLDWTFVAYVPETANA